MLDIKMRYCDSNGDTKYVLADDEFDKLYVFNEDKMKIENWSIMCSMCEVFNDIDVNQDIVYINDDLKNVVDFLREYEYEINNHELIIANLGKYEGR